jgi:hypothetical protein
MDTRTVSPRDTGPGAIPVTLEGNGAAVSLPVAPYVTLLDLLREQLQLTGTKKGCDHGQCGACTVLVDGKPINRCLKLAVTADGARITTIEGLAADGQLDELQRAFIEHDAGLLRQGPDRRRRGVHARRSARIHERQPVPLWGLSQHYGRGAGRAAPSRRLK